MRRLLRTARLARWQFPAAARQATTTTTQSRPPSPVPPPSAAGRTPPAQGKPPPTAASASSSPQRTADPALDDALTDIANSVLAFKGRLPVARLFHAITPATKHLITGSGKGVEGFLRKHPHDFKVVTDAGGVKVVSLVSTARGEKARRFEVKPPPGAVAIAPPFAMSKAALAGGPGRATSPPPTASPAAAASCDPDPEKAELSSPLPSVPVALLAGGFSLKNEPLLARLTEILADGRFYSVQKIHFELCSSDPTGISRRESVALLQFLESQPTRYWVFRKHVAKRLAEHRANMPPFTVAEDYDPLMGRTGGAGADGAASNVPAPPRCVAGAGVLPARSVGDGSTDVVTAADIEALMPYVDVDWKTVTAVNIPPVVFKTHMREKRGITTWLANLPHFFDLKFSNGAVFVRRAPRLNPDVLGMTMDEAEEHLRRRLAEDKANNGSVVLKRARHNVQFQSIFNREHGPRMREQ